MLAVEVPDHPGGLLAVLKPLKSAGINVLYFYPYLGRGASGQPIVIVGVDKTDEAIDVLARTGCTSSAKRFTRFNPPQTVLIKTQLSIPSVTTDRFIFQVKSLIIDGLKEPVW